ncbi:MAG TPA: RHS repeat-associated core domain-containing protein, partial [Thermoanaerobaculia bacterium]|nr:RHS repeat-associated core domain-containing protein [Thermoanaerobaculia bacterium]
MSQNLPLDPGAASQQPRVRAFQLDASAFGNLNDSVNRFRGDLNLPLKLVELSGRNGLDIVVSAFYGSNVREQALAWNASAPTSTLGLGWSLTSTRIFVDDKQTGNDLDGDYFLQYGGSVHALIWVGEDSQGLTYQCRDFPLWKIRFERAAQLWRVVREDGVTDVYGDAALPAADGTLMYGVKWGNWIGASRSTRPTPSRFVMGWNLARSVSPWGDALTYRYQNDEPEVVAGLRYTRSSDLVEIVDMLGQSVRFVYVPKQSFEFVPPHQMKDGAPDPLYQDRYDVNALQTIEVFAGGDREDVLYDLTFSYDFADIAGAADSTFNKRLLTGITQTRGGVLELPAFRFEYSRSRSDPNPGGLTRIELPEGGVVTIDYAEKVLNRSDKLTAARADLPTDIFDKNITVPAPDPSVRYRPFVWHGPDYLVIGWYTDKQSSRLDLTVYQFGGRWSEPWKRAQSIQGRIDIANVQVALGPDFFGLYLPDRDPAVPAAVFIVQKKRDQFGRWEAHDVSSQVQRQTSIPGETSFAAGDRLLVLHVGGHRLIDRWSFDPVQEVWSHADHGAPNNTGKMSVAALDNYYVAGYYDDTSKRASYQLFYRDPADRWRASAAGPASTSTFDWQPLYGRRFWAVGATFAAATFLPTGQTAAVLRAIWWDESFRVIGDKELEGARDGIFLETAAIGSLLANGSVLHRFNGSSWVTGSYASTAETLYAYGEDLALISRISGGAADTTLAQYDPNAGKWNAQILPRTTTERAQAKAALAVPLQVFPPTASADWFTAEDRLYRLLPDASWVELPERLPVDSTKLSLQNRAPGYLVFEDQVSSPANRKTIAWLFENGKVVGRKEYPQQRIFPGDDPASSAALLAGYRAFVTYPADQDIGAVDRIYLHRVLNHSLEDLQTDAVVSDVRQDLGTEVLVTRYDYDGDTAVFDYSGEIVQYPQVTETGGTSADPAAAGSSIHEFYNGLADQIPAGETGLLEHYSLLSGFLRRSADFDASGVELASDATRWIAVDLQHGAASPLGVLLASTQIKAGTVTNTISGLEGGGAVTKETAFTYDPATGLTVSTTMWNDDASGARQELRNEVLYAWRVAGYEGIREARMLSLTAQETLSNATAATAISSTATTYRSQWPGGAQKVWGKFESWVWRGEAKTPGTFDFAGTGDRSGWLLDNRIDARGENGKPLLLTDVDGVQSSLLYDRSGSYQVAMFKNADAGAGQAGYYGFESYESPGGWTLVGGGAIPAGFFDATVSHAGLTSLAVPADPGKNGIEARFTIPASKGRIILSCWARTLPGFPAGKAAWTVETGATSRSLPVPDTKGEWQYLFLYVDLPATGTANVVCRFTNGATGFSVWLDDVRVAPVAGDFAGRVYDPATFMPLALLDQNTAATAQVYDELIQPIAVIGASGQVTQVESRYFSRQGNGGVYNPKDPNSLLTIVPAEGGFHENLRGGQWQERWSSPDPGRWAGKDGGIEHLGTTRDALTLRDSEGAADFGIRLTVPERPGVIVNQPLGLQVGSALTVQWVPAGEWQMLDGKGAKVATFAAPKFEAGSWLLVAGRQGVMFYHRGQLILSYVFTGEVSGELRLFATSAGVLFRDVLVFWKPQAATVYRNGIGGVFQQQTLGDDHTVVSGTLYDAANRKTIDTKGRPYPGAVFQYRSNLVTGFDPATGKMTGELASYYNGQDGRSDDQGYPYTRRLYASSRFQRLLESGQAGKTLAITGSGGGANPHTTRLAYATNGQGAFPGGLPAGRYGVRITTDPQGNRLEETTDQTGRSVAVRRLAAGGGEPLSRISYSYDERGLLTRVYPPNFYQPPQAGTAESFVVTMRYDGLGRQIAQGTSDTGETEYIYDDAGRLRFTLPADGRSADPAKQPNRIQYQRYDALGRLLETGRVEALWNEALRLSARNPGWLPPGAEWHVRSVYDGDGTLPWALGQITRTEVRLAEGGPFVQEAAYDVAGNGIRVTERIEGADGFTGTTEYVYNPSSQVIETRYPELAPGAPRLTVTRAYNRLGQLRALGQPGDEDAFAAYTYNPLGDVETETLNPGGTAVATRYEYDSPERLRRIQSSGFEQTLAYEEQPGYQGTTYYNGVVARTDTRLGASGPVSTWLYGYDGLARLTTAQNLLTPAESLGTGPNPIRMDANGNILSLGLGADGTGLRTYQYYPGTDRLRNADAPGTDAYVYDGNGNIVQTPEEDHRKLSFDFVTGLAQTIENGRTAETEEIAYGLSDQRARVRLRAGGGGVTAERRYFHGGQETGPLGEVRDPGGAAQALAYVYGPTGLVALVARDAASGNETRGFLVRDHLGSSRVLVDAAGNLLGSYDYGPYGRELGTPGGGRPDLLAYRFTGQEWDGKVSLYNFKARLYDPGIQRFLSPDPASEDWSPYLYAGNNPLAAVDPTGEFSIGGFFAGLGEVVAGIALIPFTGGASLLLTGAGITGIVYSSKTDDASFSWSQWAEVEGAAAISTAEIGVGVGLAAFGEFPGAAALGATFIGAGVSSYVYTASNTQNFDWKSYGITMGIGAATGLLTGGFGELGSAAAANVAVAGIGRLSAAAATNLAKAGVQAAFGAAGGASAGYVGQGLKNVAAGQSWKDAFTNDNTWEAALLQGATGIVAGVAAFGVSKLAQAGLGPPPNAAAAAGTFPRYLQAMKGYSPALNVTWKTATITLRGRAFNPSIALVTWGPKAFMGLTRVTAPAIFNTSGQIQA